MIKDWFKKKLGVPENWDKHDYSMARYSFDDMVDFAEQYHSEQLAIQRVVGQSEQLVCPECGSTNLNEHLSNFNTCYDCEYRWAN